MATTWGPLGGEGERALFQLEATTGYQHDMLVRYGRADRPTQQD